ncbi:MAG: hypothetical protein LBK73_00790 [Treponema sp.]|nr:hypothetical protein [Treponema sp.]
MNEDIITRIYCDVDDLREALERCCKAHCLLDAKKILWFPVSRNRFVELSGCASPAHIYPGFQAGKIRRVRFIDSTPLKYAITWYIQLDGHD